MKRIVPCLLCALALMAACGGKSERYDRNVSVPKGDPAFPPLTTSWVIDRTGALSDSTIAIGDALCRQLKTDDVAEVVVVLINGVKQPEDWATHYGRWLGLGKKGLSTEGGNKGLVWLIRPDAPEKLTVSVGRGLPGFTTVDYGPIMDDAIEYLNFGNYDRGVMTLIIRTDQVLRAIQSGKK
ncbi:MAG: TPM domain-containing protein [Candidatus Krumholzibacteria bacterium]|nr:TPM domain-containing protein [Candidatus Krumholzibacteria bacterium]